MTNEVFDAIHGTHWTLAAQTDVFAVTIAVAGIAAGMSVRRRLRRQRESERVFDAYRRAIGEAAGTGGRAL